MMCRGGGPLDGQNKVYEGRRLKVVKHSEPLPVSPQPYEVNMQVHVVTGEYLAINGEYQWNGWDE